MNPFSNLQMMMGFLKMIEEQKLIKEQQQRRMSGIAQEAWRPYYQSQNPWYNPHSPSPDFTGGMWDLVRKLPPIISLMGLL